MNILFGKFDWGYTGCAELCQNNNFSLGPARIFTERIHNFLAGNEPFFTIKRGP